MSYNLNRFTLCIVEEIELKCVKYYCEHRPNHNSQRLSFTEQTNKTVQCKFKSLKNNFCEFY